MRKEMIQKFKKGQTVSELIAALGTIQVDGKPIAVAWDYRARPYLDHTVVGWVDGPPSSNVAVVFSGETPEHDYWRRFTVSRTGPGKYDIDVFPTPFNNATAPLSPGIPPSASKRAG